MEGFIKKSDSFTTSCPTCGCVQTAKFINSITCEQCGKTFTPQNVEKIDLGGYLSSEIDVKGLEERLLNIVSNLSDKKDTLYCLYISQGSYGIYYKQKYIFKKDMFDCYKFSDIYTEKRYNKSRQLCEMLSKKYNLKTKPYYSKHGRWDKHFGVAIYLSYDDVIRIKVIMQNLNNKESEKIALECRQNTLGKEAVQKIYKSKIIGDTRKYLYKLYNNCLTSKNIERCQISILLYNYGIYFGTSRFENDDLVSFYSYGYSELKSIQEINTLFVALDECLKDFINDYKCMDIEYKYAKKLNYSARDSYLQISATIRLCSSNIPNKSMFD